MIVSRKISVQATTALLAAFAALVLLAAAPSTAAAEPSYAWATWAGGSDEVDATSVSALADGSSIITGMFKVTATFGDTTLTSEGRGDGAGSVFTAKVNANGSYAWATQSTGGTDDDFASAYGVSALADGSSIITGKFNGSVTFGTTTLTSEAGPYNTDTFTAKVNADGSYAWATKGGGTGNDAAYGVSALADGSSIITGSFDGIATFGTTTLTSTRLDDTFTAKVNANGTYAWATQSGGTVHDDYAIANGVSALTDGSSIITGEFKGSVTFGTTTLTSDSELGVSFTAKVNANGSYAWATQSDGTGITAALGVSALADGSSIITGGFNGSVTFGDTSLDSDRAGSVFTAKVNANGSYAWAIKAGGTGAVRAPAAQGVSALADGSSIITGVFTVTVTFGDTTLTSEARGGEPYDTFTAKVNANGSYAWAIKAGGGTVVWASGVSALPDGSSIITGYFLGTATFGATTLTSTGVFDTFTARILADAPQAPTGVSASAGIREATITWNAVAGGLVGSYTATAAPGGASCTSVAPATSCTITGLTAGTSYTATVTATNPQGTSPPSQASNAVTPTDVFFGLTVSKSGTGGGTVTSSPAGIDCGRVGRVCRYSFSLSTSVTLTAKPTTGSSFTRWSGSGCSGTSTCTVTMSAARAVDAKFTKRPSNKFKVRSVKVGLNALTSTVVVRGPGKLTQRVTRSSRAAAAGIVCKTSRKVTKAGAVKLTCKLSAATRATLCKRSLRVSMKTTFVPAGGSSASKTKPIKLLRRCSTYTG